MENLFTILVTYLYSIGGIITFIGYFPTMKDLWNKKPSANISTYLIWTITTFIALVYGIVVLKNLTFQLVVALQLIACISILILRIRLKYI